MSALQIGALSVELAAAAQAALAGHAGSASPGRCATKLAVLPWQSLWSLADVCDPDAGTRLVIHEI